MSDVTKMTEAELAAELESDSLRVHRTVRTGELLHEASRRLREYAAKLEKEDRAHEQTVQERDDAEQALSQAYYLVTGRSPQWSNRFGHAEAHEDIGDVMNTLKSEVASLRAKLAEVERERDAEARKKREVCLVADKLAAKLHAAAAERERLMVIVADLVDEIDPRGTRIACFTTACQIRDARLASARAALTPQPAEKEESR